MGDHVELRGDREAQDTSLATVAPGIAEALAATAYGLAAAIPASIGYNRIGAAFARLGQEMASFVEERALALISRPAGVARDDAPRAAGDAVMAMNPRKIGEGLYQPLAEINVTPLVDVMLVLLIIFMVTAPMLATGIKVNLPGARTAQPLDAKDPVVVVVANDGACRSEKTRCRTMSWRRGSRPSLATPTASFSCAAIGMRPMATSCR